jgi:hypothetical protein
VQVSTTANTLTRTSGGVDFTWEINCGGRACRYGRFVNNEFWVVPIDDLGNNTGSVTVTNILPAGVNHGAEVNPSSPSNQGILTPYPSYRSSLNIMTMFPYSAKAGESIIKARTLNSGCPSSMSSGCVSSYDVLTVLSNIPQNNGATVFRPPFNGTSKPIYTTDKVKFDRLPSLSTISGGRSASAYSAIVDNIVNKWTVPHYDTTQVFLPVNFIGVPLL